MTNIIHLSDLHFGQDEFPYDLPKLTKCLADFLGEFENPIVLVTGDITFKGNQAGYVQAKEFFEYFIKQQLVTRSNFLFCPGNHDIQEGLTPFKEYDRFTYSIRRDLSNTFSSSNIQTYRDENVIIYLLNSSFHEDRKYGLIDESIFPNLEEESDAFKVVAVHHHFIGQLNDDISTIRNSYPCLFQFDKAKVGLVVHGHQHLNQQLPIGSQGFKIHGARSMGFSMNTYLCGINHICIKDNNATVTPYSFVLDEIPNKITLKK